MLFLFMLCTFVLFFSKPFGFYNSDKLHVFQNIKSETHLFILDDGVSPKVRTVSGVFNGFLDSWIVENIFFMLLMTYD